MLVFNKVYCIVKLTEFDYYHQSEERSVNFKRLQKDKQVEIIESHDNQTYFIDTLKNATKKKGIDVQYVTEYEMDKIDPGTKDLVLTCGGDGTFLSCAQKYQNSVLLGMNSDYKPKAGTGSHGALTSTNRTNLEEHLDCLFTKDYFIDRWKRLQAKVNGEIIERYAVNDIYFGQELAYKTCDVVIQHDSVEEDFNCSGILCCTGMGSHAWHYNTGGSPFSNELDAFGFRVLFPNLKHQMKFSSGIVSSRHELVIFPERDNYILSFDSKVDVIKTKLGDEVRISLAPTQKDIRVVSFYEDP